MRLTRCHLLVLSLLLGSCAFLRPAKIPMRLEAAAPLGPQRARGAFVLLPGFGDRPQTFAKHDFIATLQRQAPALDIYAADAHFAYYRKGTVIERLEQDVIAPLRTRGYRELWLVGTSMGGMGAIGYARKHPERIAGLLLFAPYLGPREVVDEVVHAGGLCKYQAAPTKEDNESSFARANFMFLRDTLCSPSSPAIWLAVGQDDRLLPANRLLGDVLPPERFLILPGGHGWKVWTPAAAQLASPALSAPMR